jgi:TolB-like protein/Tfp pilus assembly protein PilF
MIGTGQHPNLVYLRLLGGVDLQVGQGRTAIPAGRKVRALLACLALSPDRAWPREKLMALLWSDRSDEQARASLRQALAEMRRVLGEPSAVRTEHDAVSLDPAIVAVDALEFERLAKAGKWEEAAVLYRGPLLDGHGVHDDAFEDWILVERTRLHDLAVAVLERFAASQPGDAAIATAQQLLQLDPAREETHRLLMRLYAATGQRTQALRQYQQCRDILDRELQASPDTETESLHGKIQAEAMPALPTSASTAKPDIAAAPDGKPSVAVLRFTNLSGDPEQDYFSDGITEDIITELSRFRSLLVIARHSSFAFKGQAIEVKEFGRKLGARYVIEGSVRKAGNRVRVTAQLVETTTGNHVWAERYDRDLLDVFAIQDELAHAVAATVGGRVEAVGRERAVRLSPSALKAYDLVLRAKALFLKYTRSDNEQARLLAQRAIEIDPTNAQAHAYYAYCCLMIHMAHWSADRDRFRVEAIEFAKRAVTLDDADNSARWVLGLVHTSRGEYEEARFHLEKALENNPNDTEVRGEYALFLYTIGQPEAAIQHFEINSRQNPFYLSWCPWIKGWAYFTARRYGDAIAALKQLPEPINEVRGLLAASYAYAGRSAEAKAMLEEFLRVAEGDMAVFPGRRLKDWEEFWRDASWYQHQEDHDHLMDGLRKAGLPE